MGYDTVQCPECDNTMSISNDTRMVQTGFHDQYVDGEPKPVHQSRIFCARCKNDYVYRWYQDPQGKSTLQIC